MERFKVQTVSEVQNLNSSVMVGFLSPSAISVSIISASRFNYSKLKFAEANFWLMGVLKLIVILDHVTLHQWSCDTRQSSWFIA